MSGLLRIAEEAARRAGDLLLGLFGSEPTGLLTKSSSTDMVSDADRRAEQAVKETIWSARPSDVVLGEESGEQIGPVTGGECTRVRWIVDPLDGTTNWLHGLSAWAVSIAAELDGELVAGVVHAPARGETFMSARGVRAVVEDRPLRVGAPGVPGDLPLVATGFAYDPGIRARQGEIVAALLPRIRDVRREGSAALDLASVAAGRVDAYFEAPLAPWDTAAGTVLVRNAGGVVVPLELPGVAGEGVIAGSADNVFLLERLLLEVTEPKST